MTNNEIHRLRDVEALVPALRRITSRSIEALDLLLEQAAADEDEAHALVLSLAVAAEMKLWERTVRLLGGEPRGVGSVDFDGGHGWYSWSFDDEQGPSFRSYEADFDQRCTLH